jgi:hypothetical protein
MSLINYTTETYTYERPEPVHFHHHYQPIVNVQVEEKVVHNHVTRVEHVHRPIVREVVHQPIVQQFVHHPCVEVRPALDFYGCVRPRVYRSTSRVCLH